MTVYIHVPGEKAAGINSFQIVIEDMPDIIDTKQERQTVREHLQTCFGALLDTKVGVQFDDECPDCGIVGCYGECTGEPE